MTYMINPFAGTINRKQWWLFQFLILFIAVASFFLVGAIDSIIDLPNDGVIVIVLAFCLLTYPNFATSLNRLRDTGRSGWWYLAFMAPTVGTGIMIYMCGIAEGKQSISEHDYGAVFGSEDYQLPNIEDLTPSAPPIRETRRAITHPPQHAQKPRQMRPNQQQMFGKRNTLRA